MKLVTKIMIGMGAGVLVGLAFTTNPAIAATYIKPIGTLFLNLIKMTIVPLVFASLVVGASSIGDTKKLGRIGGKTMIFFFITTAIAIIVGLFLANILKPGIGLSLNLPAETSKTVTKAPSLAKTLLDIVPPNPLMGLGKGNMLQIIFFALVLGVGATKIGKKGEAFLKVCDSLAEIMYKLTEMIMSLAPYGVFALIVPVIAENGPSVLLPLLKVIGVVYLGFIIHSVIAYSFSVTTFAKISPLTFFKKVSPATILAFSTSSSAGTLPLTMGIVKKKFGVSDGISSFVLPLGTTINMDGTAIYQGVCAIFIAQAYGIHLGPAQQLTILLTALLASIGTAGVPGSGFMMLMMVLSSVGLPLEGAALIGGIDRILDMGRTAVNVTGNAAASIVVAASEGELSEPSA
ncbi:dicarboxylate/amino acid:cation symporter [Clostridium botulinum]|uniref:Sodium:dicarboxylate symporter n=1 Tax=Clostridium botulinum C/D str. DC5 TaxID=1443128 RepID=A0A0A0IID5_CLOBO|nr:dicarboxylate/amino acid:cation symporter [Clostridium botulinum]KEI07494.1 sodium:dicarboxylate symporter [Clostridium botulinum C/D str. BKT75002]KEI09862.1 sodium:dicarboxylate symporter [Clostridium botulinum C/D str. BKT2873]KGM97610.1 sodium:dicarboxylate symporter [Clostridium botulinum D str. CCUG 7971]KGN00708.1 sodium:dicarboxylate symporter [Clostridium botulinum C/D str. DC5]KOC51012.1 sodium:dicarboxylate symporter [Clostridium botulinum]